MYNSLRLGGLKKNEIEVAAHFESVAAAHEGYVVGEFKPPLNAINGGVRLASEVGKSRYVHRDIGAPRKLGKTKVQTTAGDLHAEFVESGTADGSVMLKGKAEVARLAQTGACAGILTEDLILRRRRKACNKRWGDTHTKERTVAIVPILIDTGGP